MAAAQAGSRPSPRRHVVEIVDRQRVWSVPRAWLSRVCRRALAEEGVARATITLVFVDDAGIAALHDRWLGDPTPTDVITFDLGDGDRLCGDIACSTETALREAARYGWSARHELAYYMIHGLLHLTGYDDHAVARRRAMRARERAVFAALDLPAPPRRSRRP
ncbi:MAG: rRNA maturation RNase YbeY [Planctomycetota bacterium]